jgi:MauM/NapG family ferredoxin protein
LAVRSRRRVARWRRIRRIVQILALGLFLALLVYANAQRSGPFWADLFSRFDPLSMVSASLAGRVLVGGLVLAAITLLLTLVLGRVWCGWLCPLGTILEWLGPRSPRRPAPADRWRAIKYLLLVAVLVSALFGSQVLIFLDPLTILNRTVSTAAWPALRSGIVHAETFLYRFQFLWGPLDAVHNAAVQPLFQDVQPVFGLGVLIALFFVGLVALNWWAERFWCRYLCPLGGLLGSSSRLSLLGRDVSDDCVECGRCTPACPTGTIDPEDGFRSDPAECIVCLDCLVDCTRDSTSFRWHLPGRASAGWRPAPAHDYDPTRRQMLAAMGASVAGVALLAAEPITRRQPATLVRPPGAMQTDFSGLCIRCAACVRVCPTQGLQPTLFEGGAQNLLTPQLVPRLGYCNFGCNACGQVCPTGAIPPLPLEEKQRTPIGLARVDRDRCLPWAYDIPCIVCEESCPVADKAIKLEEVEIADAQGQPVLLQRPRVVRELCIGCGICEHQCPMGGEAAIRVFAPTDVTTFFG